jgi:hypothetical protein
MQRSTLEVPEAAGGAPEQMEVAAEEAATATGGEEVTMTPEAALEVVVRSPEIQDAEPIRSALMTEAATSSRGGGGGAAGRRLGGPGDGGQAPGGGPPG